MSEPALNMMGPEPIRFDGKVVIVTGGARGLGLAHAKALAARGAKVVINDTGVAADGTSLDEAAASAAVDNIIANGGQAIASFASVATPDGADAIVQSALNAYGRVDILINNAGVAHFASFAEMTPAALDLLLDVHVRGSFLVAHRAWREMARQGGGRIINTLSTAGYYGQAGNSVYAMCKSALMGLTRSLALEGAEVGIVVNGIAPGGWSRMTESYADTLGADQREMLLRALAPEDPAALVMWLAHDSCTVSGEFYSAMSGRVSRNLVIENLGLVVDAGTLTPEHIAASQAVIKNMAIWSAPTSVEDAATKLEQLRDHPSSQPK